MEAVAHTQHRHRRRFPLRAQFGAAFGLVLAALIAIAVMGVLELSATAAEAEDLLDRVQTADASIVALERDFGDVKGQILRLEAQDEAGVAAGMGELEARFARMDEALNAFAAAYEEDFGAQATDFDRKLADWAALQEVAAAHLSAPDSPGSPTPAEVDDQIVLFGEDIHGFVDDVSTAEEAEHAAAHADARRVRLTLIGVGIAGTALAIAAGLVLSGRIINATAKVKHSLEALAQRDLTVEADVDSGDEIGDMARALNAAQGSLRDTLSEVLDSSQMVAAAAEELSSANVQVAAGSQEASVQAGVVAQAAGDVNTSVHSIASGAEEMGESIKEISHNANEAAKVASHATEVAERTNAQIAKLGVSSQEIGDVLKVITGIAEQTNLLALNATIEAARAGEMGKGFAVVAGEVKDLAQETAKATDEVAHRVQAIQDDTSGAVEAIAEISQIVKHINDFQLTIASAVEEQTATTAEMSRSVSQAADGAGDIATNISVVAEASANSAQVLDQIGMAVNELAELSAALRGRVQAFVF